MSDVSTQTISARAPKAPIPVVAPETVQFNHPGKKVFILIPVDANAARLILDELEPLIFEMAHPPKIDDKLRLGLMRDNMIIYVAVTDEKRTVENRKMRMTTFVKISDPIDCSQFGTSTVDDGLGGVDEGKLCDAIQKVAMPFSARRSADKEIDKRTVRLFTT